MKSEVASRNLKQQIAELGAKKCSLMAVCHWTRFHCGFLCFGILCLTSLYLIFLTTDIIFYYVQLRGFLNIMVILYLKFYIYLFIYKLKAQLNMTCILDFFGIHMVFLLKLLTHQKWVVF